MADESSTTSSPGGKVYIPVPDGYWDLPEDQRLALADQMAAELRSRLQGSTTSPEAGTTPGGTS